MTILSVNVIIFKKYRMDEVLSEQSFFNKNNWNSWIKVTYCSSNTWRNYKFNYTHSHDRLEILYVYYGELTLIYSDNNSWKERTLYSNNYILIDTGVPHTIRTGESESLVFSIELKLVPEAISGLKYSLRHLISCDKYVEALFSQEQKVIQLSDSRHVAPMLHELQKCLEDAKFEHDNFIDLLISAIFFAIGKDFYTQQYSLHSGIKYLRKAIDYINLNYHRELPCAQVAKSAGISLNYLNRLFTEQFGMTVNNYINYLRIQEAKQLIERTDISLAEIYIQVGYKNNQNFSKQFMRHIGCSPSQYRKRLRDSRSEMNFEKNTNLIFNLPEN